MGAGATPDPSLDTALEKSKDHKLFSILPLVVRSFSATTLTVSDHLCLCSKENAEF